MALRSAALAALALGAAQQLSSASVVGSEGACPAGEDPAACAAAAGGGELDEVTSMLAIQRLRREGKMQNRGKDVKCPGADNFCAGNQCCGRIPWTSGRTFPCPTADPDFAGCEVNTEEEIIQGLLKGLRREEKYKFVRGVGWENDTYDTKPGYYVGDSGLHEKHGIPPLLMQDNGQGFRTVDARMIPEVTGWPSTLAVAATWNEEMTEKWGQALGQEFRAKGANVILGPGVNVHRVALNGRNAEYVSGEAPYLGVRLTPPYVKGVQSQGVLAVVKHFALNQQELNRDTVDAIVDDRTLWEVYYKPFEAAVQAGVASFMCSYNLVNGVHACGNRDILLRDLKGKMGFEGFVMSDWWALHSFAAEDGVDQEMPGDSSPSNPAWYTDANLDTLSEEKLDDMVGRQLRMISKVGLWKEKTECQPPECEYFMYEANASTPEHKELAKDLATQAVTLLKNTDDVLPLKKTSSTIALVGFACYAPQDDFAQLQDWQAGSYYNIGGSGRVIADDPITVYEGMQAKCEEYGCTIKTYRGSNPHEAEAFINMWKPDVVVMCGGSTATEGRDRASLSVDQESFMVDLADILAVPPHKAPVVSITMVPAQSVMPWVDKVSAAVTNMLAGTYTGAAFADVLFGDWNPSGKLPVTFPISVNDTILACPQDLCPYSEELHTGYAWYLGKPVTFPFGHGLSYTRFDYKRMTILPADKDGVRWVEATIRNIGDREGIEVAQLYLSYPERLWAEPKTQLRGFVRKELRQGKRAVFRFPLTRRDFQIYDKEEGAWVDVSGLFTIEIGSSSRDLRLGQTLRM